MVGDSTAVGTGATAPSRSVAGLPASGLPNLRVVNRAADGARYADIVRQLQDDSARYDAVLVMGGGNDVIRGTRRKHLQAQVREVATLARQRAPFVVLMPPGNVGRPCGAIWPCWPRRCSCWWQESAGRCAPCTG